MMEKELDDLMMEYARRFGDGFPSFQLLRGRTTEEGIALVKRCLDEGKDAYDLGLVSDDLDIEY